MNLIRSPSFLPILIIVLFVLAAVRYAFAGDWARVAYWLGGAVLNIAVLNMGST